MSRPATGSEREAEFTRRARRGEGDDVVRDLVGRLVLEPAGLLVEAVPAGVLLGRVPERLAVVVVEPARVGGHDLEPVLALLQALHDRLGQQVLPLLPVARLERPGLLLGGGGEHAGGENGRAETHAELHSVSPRIGGASRAGLRFGRLSLACQGLASGAACRSFSSSQPSTPPTSSPAGPPTRRA